MIKNAILSIFCFAFCLSVAPTVQAIDVWIGTTTPRKGLSKGIYHAEFNTDSGKLGPVTLAAEFSSPGFLVMHPSEPRLYSTGARDGKPVVAAFGIERKAGRSTLELLNTVAIPDGGAAHINLDRTGKLLMTAQYGAGSTALFQLADDFSIARHVQTAKHEGGSRVVGRRQDSPHAHWVGPAPDNRFVFVPDLGLDQVVIYQLDARSPKLIPHGSANVPPGGGPRHMKFHSNGRWVYVLNELSLSVTVFHYDPKAGTMKAVQTIETLPDEAKAKESFNSASEIRVHPSGKFVYSANRGHDTITVFRIDLETGKLTFVEREPIRGSWPRNFNVDPSGKWLLAAGRDSNTIAVFQINPTTGELMYIRSTAMAPSPICVEFGR